MAKPCRHATPSPSCRVCWLARYDPRYMKAWGVPGEPEVRPTESPFQPVKPRLSINELAARRRKCRQLKEAGLPCPDDPKCNPAVPPPTTTWSYGITTVPKRRDDLFPRTLASLKAAGFDAPHLFVDGCNDSRSWSEEFGLPVTARGGSNVRTAGNWVLSLYELYYRSPQSAYYALFQDDFVCSRNLRAYLDRHPCPQPGYMNLYTFPRNQKAAPRTQHGGTVDGWFPSVTVAKGVVPGVGEVAFQVGLGAVALVFTRQGVIDLLGSHELAGRPIDPDRGHRSIDGGVVHAMNRAGYVEYVHSPSLVQHTGEVSSMGNRKYPPAESFRGEKFDLLDLLPAARQPAG